MPRIPEYTQGQLASSVVGTPGVDTSGFTLARSDLNTTNALASSVSVGQGGGFSGGRSGFASLGNALKRMFAQQERAKQQRQKFLDAGDVSRGSTELTLRQIDLRSQIKQDNADAPDKWAAIYREKAPEVAQSFFQEKAFNPTVQQSIERGFNNRLASDYGSFQEAGTQFKIAQDKKAGEALVNSVEEAAKRGDVTLEEARGLLDTASFSYKIGHGETETATRLQEAQKNILKGVLSNEAMKDPEGVIGLLSDAESKHDLTPDERKEIIGDAQGWSKLYKTSASAGWGRTNSSYLDALNAFKTDVTDNIGTGSGNIDVGAITSDIRQIREIRDQYSKEVPKQFQDATIVNKFNSAIKEASGVIRKAEGDERREDREQKSLEIQDRQAESQARTAAAQEEKVRLEAEKNRLASDQGVNARSAVKAGFMQLRSSLTSNKQNRFKNGKLRHPEQIQSLVNDLKSKINTAEGQGLLTKRLNREKLVEYNAVLQEAQRQIDGSKLEGLPKFAKETMESIFKQFTNATKNLPGLDSQADFNSVTPVPKETYDRLGIQMDDRKKDSVDEEATRIYTDMLATWQAGNEGKQLSQSQMDTFRRMADERAIQKTAGK